MNLKMNWMGWLLFDGQAKNKGLTGSGRSRIGLFGAFVDFKNPMSMLLPLEAIKSEVAKNERDAALNDLNVCLTENIPNSGKKSAGKIVGAFSDLSKITQESLEIQAEKNALEKKQHAFDVKYEETIAVIKKALPEIEHVMHGDDKGGSNPKKPR